MKALAVIPARLGSTRLPEKPLVTLHGRPLVEHVWRAVCRARRPARVVVATDSERVRAVAQGFGAEAVLTSPAHVSGSDRVAEVARRLPEFDAVVNVQGDEPLLDAAAVDAALAALESDPAADLATLAHWEDAPAARRRPQVVAVDTDAAGYATGFARGGPACRDEVPFLRHVGLYAYRRAALLAFASWPPTAAERAASLEQLRLLEHGLKMRVVVTSYRSHAVDTAADLAFLETNWDRLAAPAGPDPHPSSCRPESPE